ncbi:MAG: hypothetical protein U9P10_07395 [Thermodesulfobacteriota bacterium]|nr:hypothetical protein [Thermodesulfobacteriota bacterium]
MEDINKLLRSVCFIFIVTAFHLVYDPAYHPFEFQKARFVDGLLKLTYGMDLPCLSCCVVLKIEDLKSCYQPVAVIEKFENILSPEVARVQGDPEAVVEIGYYFQEFAEIQLESFGKLPAVADAPGVGDVRVVFRLEVGGSK